MVYRFDDNEINDYVQIESMYWLGCCYIHTYMNEIRLIGIVRTFETKRGARSITSVLTTRICVILLYNRYTDSDRGVFYMCRCNRIVLLSFPSLIFYPGTSLNCSCFPLKRAHTHTRPRSTSNAAHSKQQSCACACAPSEAPRREEH